MSEKAARAYLEGLKKRAPAPWDEPIGDSAPPPPPAKPSPPPPKPAPRSTADDAMDQAERIAERNRDFAKRTRHLRKD